MRLISTEEFNIVAQLCNTTVRILYLKAHEIAQPLADSFLLKSRDKIENITIYITHDMDWKVKTYNLNQKPEDLQEKFPYMWHYILNLIKNTINAEIMCTHSPELITKAATTAQIAIQ